MKKIKLICIFRAWMRIPQRGERSSKKALYELMRVVCFLRTVEGLENLTVDSVAPETGVRETGRVVGERIITAEEYITGYDYPDSVCYAFYPIDPSELQCRSCYRKI